ncbi:MAG: putative phosphohydrolase [Parcubacteria group bacterium Gr01-1014_29]|nr:MAG: putative phosphohydrolase [Parcubacteria group bacterium Gr01-1014_29]
MKNHTVHTPKRITVLYHADCADGFGAAWAAWKKFGKKAVYIAVPPSNRELPRSARGTDLYTLDYAIPLDAVDEIRKQVLSLTVIDHHVSNKASAEKADERLFQLENSGAVLAWKFFHGSKKAPRLLRHIEDSDLWKFHLKHTREITEALMLYDMNFKTWDKLIRDFENKKEKKYIEEGKVLLRLRERRIGRLIGFGEKRTFEGYKALVVNSPFYVSEIGHSIVKHGTPVAIIWSYREGKIVVSLRSDGKEVNVAELAELYGGGGHPAAAGFTFKVKDFLKFKKKK